MTNKIELISKQRRAGLISMAFIFLVLQSLSMSLDHDWIGYMLNVALVLFAYGGLSIVFQNGRYESKQIEDALEDELVNSHRNTAFRYGFYASMIAAALLSLITPFWQSSGEFVARVVLSTGVVTPMLVFSYIDRDDA